MSTKVKSPDSAVATYWWFSGIIRVPEPGGTYRKDYEGPVEVCFLYSGYLPGDPLDHNLVDFRGDWWPLNEQEIKR